MEITFGRIFLIIFVLSGLPSAASRVNGLDFKHGTFQNLQQHPQLKMCAASVLQENEYVGCRVSELTGECEPLTHSWGLKQTVEQGYAYAMKVFLEENFLPPLTPVLGSAGLSWKIPVVLNAGSQIDIFMSIPDWHKISPGNDEMFVLRLMNGSDDFEYMKHHRLTFVIKRGYTDISEWVNNGVVGDIKGKRLSALASPEEMFQISILAQPNAFAMFVEDEEVATLKLLIRPSIMRQISANSSGGKIFVHGIKFTGVLE